MLGYDSMAAASTASSLPGVDPPNSVKQRAVAATLRGDYMPGAITDYSVTFLHEYDAQNAGLPTFLQPIHTTALGFVHWRRAPLRA